MRKRPFRIRPRIKSVVKNYLIATRGSSHLMAMLIQLHFHLARAQKYLFRRESAVFSLVSPARVLLRRSLCSVEQIAKIPTATILSAPLLTYICIFLSLYPSRARARALCFRRNLRSLWNFAPLILYTFVT